MPFLAGGFGPDSDPAVGGAGVDGTVAGDGDGVDGVFVGGDRFEASEIGGSPDLEGFVPGGGVDEVLVGGEGGDGVSVLDPEAFAVAADGDVVFGEGEAEEAVREGGEGGDLGVAARVWGGWPEADAAVLVGG